MAASRSRSVWAMAWLPATLRPAICTSIWLGTPKFSTWVTMSDGWK